MTQIELSNKPSSGSKNKFDNKVENTWCPGCGNFGIQNAIKAALDDMNLNPEDVLLVSGIGQAAKMPHYIKANGLNGLHGRGLPLAFGAYVANPELKILLSTGDGDAYGEGGNHFIHNIRRNLDIVHMVHDNQVYGLTKGQASPTTAMGQKTTLQLDGVRLNPLNPVAMAVSLGASFVARAFSGDQDHLKEIIKLAMQHKGYALIDIMQPCVTFNKINTYKWYKDRIYKLNEDYDPTDQQLAFAKALEWGDEGIPTGLIYRNDQLTFLERIDHLKDFKPLAKRNRTPMDIHNILETFK